MATFPSNPSLSDTHTIGEKSWSWNGYAWDKQVTASSSDSHGHTGADVVDSFNGLTGDVNTSDLVLHVEGISSDNGITLGSNIASTNALGFSILNQDGNAFLNAAALNTTIGDVNGDGNGNKILVRDSHNIINLTAATSIGLKSSIVTIEEKLRHDGDTNTHIAFPANDEMTLTTAGVTLAHLTDMFTFPKGLSVSNGITLDGNLTIDGDIVSNDNLNIQRPSGELVVSFLGSSTIINNSGANQDVIIKGNGDSQLIYSDAGNNRVGIGTGTPTHKLQVEGTIAADTGITLGGGITFSDGTFQSTAAAAGGGGATQSIGFIIDGNGSPLTTGDKLDAIKQIPFNSYILSSSLYVQEGLTGSESIELAIKKVTTLSDVTTTGAAGITLEPGSTGSTDQVGLTMSGNEGSSVFFKQYSDVSNITGSSVDSNEWIYPRIIGNSGDTTKLQVFLTVVPI